MKKFLLSLIVMTAAMAANAQVFVGGEFTLWRNYDANVTNFKLLPTIGYDLTDKWSVGTQIGYAHDYEAGAKWNSFIIAPFARYNAVKFGPVTIFGDMEFTYAMSKLSGTSGTSDAFEVGIKPGLKVKLVKQLSFVSHFGFIGYRHTDGLHRFNPGSTGFGLDFSGNNLSIGVSYDF